MFHDCAQLLSFNANLKFYLSPPTNTSQKNKLSNHCRSNACSVIDPNRISKPLKCKVMVLLLLKTASKFTFGIDRSKGTLKYIQSTIDQSFMLLAGETAKAVRVIG